MNLRELAKKDAAFLFLPDVLAAGVLAYFIPESVHTRLDFLLRNSVLEIQAEGNLGAVEDSFHGFAAELEARRPFDASVGEVDVPKD